MILGVISSRSVQHHALAAHFVNDVQTSSNIRRIERFFKEQVIAFGSLARILLEMITLPYKFFSVECPCGQQTWGSLILACFA